MISMARPFLADPDFIKKAEEGRSDEINTCIACNQACLDHVFERKIASCLVNPQACHETELVYSPVKNKKKIAVVGAGPAGMSFSCVAAERGHEVTMFDGANEIGGQFNIAKQIPGKEEFHETLRYFSKRIQKANVNVKLNTTVDVNDLKDFDAIVLSTGIQPRTPKIDGVDHAKVMSYLDVLKHKKDVAGKVAIIGAGGIGIDIAHYLTSKSPFSNSIPEYLKTYDILDSKKALEIIKPKKRSVTVFQRSKEKIGKKLGKTTGWAHIQTLKSNGVHLVSGANYLKIDDDGLHYEIFPNKGNESKKMLIKVDNVIVAAGQEPKLEFKERLSLAGLEIFVIGGAKNTKDLDAKTAISDGAELAAII